MGDAPHHTGWKPVPRRNCKITLAVPERLAIFVESKTMKDMERENISADAVLARCTISQILLNVRNDEN